MNTLRETQYHSHSHPHIFWLCGHHDTTATFCAVAFGINRLRGALSGCVVSMQSRAPSTARYASLLSSRLAKVVGSSVDLRASSTYPKNKRNNYARCHAYQGASSGAVHARGLVSSHITLRSKVSNSIDIFSSSSVVLWGASWVSNQQHDACCGQIAAGSNMSPKIFGLWTGEFPSAISRSLLRPARQSNFWLSARTAIAAPRNAGYPERARRQAEPSTSSLPTSCRASADRSAA